MSAWFRESFPDATNVDATDPHVDVRAAIERLGLVRGSRKPGKLLQKCFHPFQKILSIFNEPERCDLRIIGVVREPFELLVSLYEYWRRIEFQEEPDSRLIRAARTQGFRTFVECAVVDRRLATYEKFFDVGGPCWATTTLLDFHALEGALAAVCQEFGIHKFPKLNKHNAAPRRMRAVCDYVAEVGDLRLEVGRYFRWYYEEARHIVVRGNPSWCRRAA